MRCALGVSEQCSGMEPETVFASKVDASMFGRDSSVMGSCPMLDRMGLPSALTTDQRSLGPTAWSPLDYGSSGWEFDSLRAR